MREEQRPDDDIVSGEPGVARPGQDDHLRSQIRKLVLMRETGPKSAAWHRARVQTIWRLQRQAADGLNPGS